MSRAALAGAFRAAVAAADPARGLAAHLPPKPSGRTVVIGAGKAAGQMAAALEAAWDGPLGGLVITRYGHAAGLRLERIALAEAAHPVPDAAGLAASARLVGLLRGLGPQDLVIALVSGGGSALLCQPLPGLPLAAKQDLTRALLASGATIGEINTVRQRLSAVKGGRLAALAAPAPVVTLLISDVPGDAPDLVASGPTVPCPAPAESAEEILARYRITPPAAIRAALARPESHPPRALANAAAARLIAAPALSLAAAAADLRARGWEAVILSDRIEGEAREAGRVLAGIAQGWGGAAPGRIALLSGGETTVTLPATTLPAATLPASAPCGRGGRNAEFALGAALALRGAQAICGLAADTDGLDGTGPHAGAFFDGQSAARMRAAGIDPFAALAAHDAAGAFAALGDLLETGPTGTNVNDFRAFLIGA